MYYPYVHILYCDVDGVCMYVCVGGAELVMNIVISSECVGARDPHCMWSDESLQCVATPLSITTTGTVNNTL